MTNIESSFNDGESDEHSTAVPSTLTRARRVSDREGSAAQTMTTTTSSELEFRRDLAALDADIARLQVHFQVALYNPYSSLDLIIIIMMYLYLHAIIY